MNTYQAKIGYARTSTVDQNLDTQVAALKAAGCGMVRTKQKSGASLEGRPELKTILDFIHKSETLVVTRIDRLARSLSDLETIVTRLKEKSTHLAATEQPLDTSTAAGKAFCHMLGVFAEFETNLRRERQAEGIAAGKRRGVYRGRTPKIDMDAIKAKLVGGARLPRSPAIWVSRVERSIKQGREWPQQSTPPRRKLHEKEHAQTKTSQ